MNLQILQPSSREAIQSARVWWRSPSTEFKRCSPLRENISLHKSHGLSSVRLRVLLGSDRPSISGAGRRRPRATWSSMEYFKLMLRMVFHHIYDVKFRKEWVCLLSESLGDSRLYFTYMYGEHGNWGAVTFKLIFGRESVNYSPTNRSNQTHLQLTRALFSMAQGNKGKVRLAAQGFLAHH